MLQTIARFGFLCSLGALAAAQTPPQFESPQIRPVDVSADGLRLLAVNTPDSRIALFSLADPRRPVLLREIAVGLEPVAVRFRTGSEAWVVNHLSDSLSVVDLDAGFVTATIQLGDEPSDVVFAGGRAFVTIATRREVAVIDTSTRAVIATIPVFADEPRWSVLSADGTRLFVAAHKSGNDTTTVPEHLAPPQPAPSNPALPPAPSVGLLVDSEDPAWAAAHGVVLPDYDVFEIDTSALNIVRRHVAIGTILFGMAVRPVDGSLWIANTEARNLVRFEPALRGHIVDNRVSRVDVASNPANVSHFDLNPGIDYGVLPNPSALATALAQPTDVVFASNGAELYVAAFGTDRVGVLDPDTGAILARIEIGTAPGSVIAPRSKRGPRGLAQHPTTRHLYVLNRLANSLSVVDTAARVELRELSLAYDPTPVAHKEGRGFLYDAKLSGNGTASCASCHIDATTDNIGWDLGDPSGAMVTMPSLLGPVPLHPMKGPMVTQSLVGLAGLAPLHWRGDRTNFSAFDGAFDSLLGGSVLGATDMGAFRQFVETVVYPPNPNLNRDRSLPTTPLGASAAEGRALYVTQQFRPGARCVDCHSLTTGTNNQIFTGPILGEPQAFKVAQLRNVYKRDGKKPVGGLRTSGYGQLHDGTDDDVFALLSRTVFGPLSSNAGNKAKLQAFVEAFDTGIAPTVGFSVTLDVNNRQLASVLADRDLLLARAATVDCDVVVRGQIDGQEVGMRYDSITQRFRQNRTGAADMTLAQLDSLLAAGRATLTLLGVPRGHGQRFGLDRDLDGVLDGDDAPIAYGASTAGCNHELTTSSPSWLGNEVFSLSTAGATPGSLGSLWLGFARAAIPVFGIDILVDPSVLVAVALSTDARGVAAVSLALPDDPTLVGTRLFAQSIFIDTCGAFGLAASGGLEITVR